MPTQIPNHECDCGNDTFYFTKDLNLTAAWKVGNKYCRVCTACGSRYFLAKSLWEQVDDQYVIVKNGDEPVPVFDCPGCGESVTGTPPKCPFCDIEYMWDEQEAVEEVEDPDPHDEVEDPDEPVEPEPDEGDGDDDDGGEPDEDTDPDEEAPPEAEADD